MSLVTRLMKRLFDSASPKEAQAALPKTKAAVPSTAAPAEQADATCQVHEPASDRTRQLPTLSSFDELEPLFKKLFMPSECQYTFWLNPNELCDIVENYQHVVGVSFQEAPSLFLEDICHVHLFDKSALADSSISLTGLYTWPNASSFVEYYLREWNDWPSYIKAVPILADLQGNLQVNFTGWRDSCLWDLLRKYEIPPSTLRTKLSLRREKLVKEIGGPAHSQPQLAPDLNLLSQLASAAEQGDAARCESLTLAGAPPDIPDSTGWTPLMHTALRGHAEAARILLAAGADPNRTNRLGSSPLCMAATHGHASVAALLIEHGANVNAVGYAEWTPLMLAAREGRFEVFKLLLNAGADLYHIKMDGPVPINVFRCPFQHDEDFERSSDASKIIDLLTQTVAGGDVGNHIRRLLRKGVPVAGLGLLCAKCSSGFYLANRGAVRENHLTPDTNEAFLAMIRDVTKNPDPNGVLILLPKGDTPGSTGPHGAHLDQPLVCPKCGSRDFKVPK